MVEKIDIPYEPDSFQLIHLKVNSKIPTIDNIILIKTDGGLPQSVDFMNAGKLAFQLTYISFLDIITGERSGSFFTELDSVKFHFAKIHTHCEEKDIFVYLRDICADMALNYYSTLNNFNSPEQVSALYERVHNIYMNRKEFDEQDLFFLHTLSTLVSPATFGAHLDLSQHAYDLLVNAKRELKSQLSATEIMNIENMGNFFYRVCFSPNTKDHASNEKILEKIMGHIKKGFEGLDSLINFYRDPSHSFRTVGVPSPYFAHPEIQNSILSCAVMPTQNDYADAMQNDAAHKITQILNSEQKQTPQCMKRAIEVKTLLQYTNNWKKDVEDMNNQKYWE